MVVKEIMTYFEWRDDKQKYKLYSFLKIAKENYFNQHSHNIKQIIFNRDQLSSEPQYNYYVNQVVPQLDDYNVPWRPMPKPSLGVPRTLIVTVQPLIMYTQFNVTSCKHKHLSRYLPWDFFRYYNSIQAHPNYAYFTGQESTFPSQYHGYYQLEDEPLTLDEKNDLCTINYTQWF